jgi:zinc-binding in reverse transcriptase
MYGIMVILKFLYLEGASLLLCQEKALVIDILTSYPFNLALPDTISWSFHISGIFSVHSLYMFLNFGRVKVYLASLVWKLYLPLKIKVFIWLALRGKILTRDVLSHRDWCGSLSCFFCYFDKFIDHLFVSCDASFTFWNKFNRYNNKDIFYYWGLSLTYGNLLCISPMTIVLLHNL